MSALHDSTRKTSRLSREIIVDVALRLAEQAGVENLSIRKVALRLGVTPMALYKHFNNKEELLSIALDAFIARANVIPAEELSWEDWLQTVGRRMYSALCSDFQWISILGSVRVGAEGTRVTDAVIERLTDAGFTREQAAQGYFAVIQTVLGAVCLQSSMNSVSRSDLEPVARLEQIDIGLPMIINALRHELQIP